MTTVREKAGRHKAKIWTIGGSLAAIASGVAIWSGIGLPKVVWDTQLEAVVDPLVDVSRDYLEQRSYNLRRENFEWTEALLLAGPEEELTPSQLERIKLIKELLRANTLRQEKLEEFKAALP